MEGSRHDGRADGASTSWRRRLTSKALSVAGSTLWEAALWEAESLGPNDDDAQELLRPNDDAS